VSLPLLSILSWRTRSWLSVRRRPLGVAVGRAASAVAGVAACGGERCGQRWLYASRARLRARSGVIFIAPNILQRRQTP